MLDQVLALAKRAASEVLQVYHSEFAVQAKGDGSPLTEADLRSHHTLTLGLAALTPDLPVLSEECQRLAWATRRRWDRFWLIDPLDGTKEFVDRNGEFTVNVALIEAGRPVLGVVGAPALDTWFASARGRGAWRQLGASEPEPIQCRPRSAHSPWRVVASRSHPSTQLVRWLGNLGEHRTLPMGSSLKLCLVAAGEADLYPRLGPTMEWDTAAAHAIVAEAGGGVIATAGTRGRALEYNKESLVNPPFVCAESAVAASVLAIASPSPAG